MYPRRLPAPVCAAAMALIPRTPARVTAITDRFMINLRNREPPIVER
jgi:hypothetical protein